MSELNVVFKVSPFDNLIFYNRPIKLNMTLDARKPVLSVCEQQSLRQVCPSAQSGQRLCHSIIGNNHIYY